MGYFKSRETLNSETETNAWLVHASETRPRDVHLICFLPSCTMATIPSSLRIHYVYVLVYWQLKSKRYRYVWWTERQHSLYTYRAVNHGRAFTQWRNYSYLRRARSKISRDASKLFFILILLLLLIRRDNVMRHRSVSRGRTTSPCCNYTAR